MDDQSCVPSSSPNWIGANKTFRLAKPSAERRADPARQFCSTREGSQFARERNSVLRVQLSTADPKSRAKTHALANLVDGIYRRINDSVTCERIHKIGVQLLQCYGVRGQANLGLRHRSVDGRNDQTLKVVRSVVRQFQSQNDRSVKEQQRLYAWRLAKCRILLCLSLSASIEKGIMTRIESAR